MPVKRNDQHTMAKTQDNFLRDLQGSHEALFLSGDKLSTQQYLGYDMPCSTQMKLKIQNTKDHTPLNIFQTYLKSSTLVSPIMNEAQQTDFCEHDTVDDFFDFPRQAPSQPKDASKQGVKSTFKDKVKNIKSDFKQLITKKQQAEEREGEVQEERQMLMSQRVVGRDDKENNFKLSNHQ